MFVFERDSVRFYASYLVFKVRNISRAITSLEIWARISLLWFKNECFCYFCYSVKNNHRDLKIMNSYLLIGFFGTIFYIFLLFWVFYGNCRIFYTNKNNVVHFYRSFTRLSLLALHCYSSLRNLILSDFRVIITRYLWYRKTNSTVAISPFFMAKIWFLV